MIPSWVMLTLASRNLYAHEYLKTQKATVGEFEAHWNAQEEQKSKIYEVSVAFLVSSNVHLPPHRTHCAITGIFNDVRVSDATETLY